MYISIRLMKQHVTNPAIHTALFGKLACLYWLGNFKHTFATPFGVLSKKKIWGLLTEANLKGFYYNELDL